jgi:hypothetical protein
VNGYAARRRAQAAEHAARLAALVMAAAGRLRAELERYGVAAAVHEGRGVALVSVRSDLQIWVQPGPQGLRYRWWTGEISDTTGRCVFIERPAHAVEETAQRIAARCRQPLARHPVFLATGRAAPAYISPASPGGDRR